MIVFKNLAAFCALYVLVLLVSLSTAVRPLYSMRSLGIVKQQQQAPQSVVLTNARRLQDGLPLKAPARRSTGTYAARQLVPSALPSLLGLIQAIDVATGQIIGFIDSLYSSTGIYTLTPSSSNALQIILPSTVNQGGMFSIRTSNVQDISLPFLGGTSANGNNIISDTLNFYYITSVDDTGRNNSFTQQTGIPRPSQHLIWSTLRAGSGATSLTPRWTNTNGTIASGSLAFTQDVLVATGDERIFSATFPDARYINFVFQPSRMTG